MLVSLAVFVCVGCASSVGSVGVVCVGSVGSVGSAGSVGSVGMNKKSIPVRVLFAHQGRLTPVCFPTLVLYF